MRKAKEESTPAERQFLVDKVELVAFRANDNTRGERAIEADRSYSEAIECVTADEWPVLGELVVVIGSLIARTVLGRCPVREIINHSQS